MGGMGGMGGLGGMGGIGGMGVPIAPVVPSGQGSHDRGSRRVTIEENFDRGQGSQIG